MVGKKTKEKILALADEGLHVAVIADRLNCGLIDAMTIIRKSKEKNENQKTYFSASTSQKDEVLKMVADGCRIKEIVAKTKLSEATIQRIKKAA